MILTYLRLFPLVAIASLAACSSGPHAPSPPPPPPAATHQSEIDEIVMLLDQGHKDAAGKRVKTLLKRNPSDPQARVLSDSIDKDPVELLGPKSFNYTVKPGDTMIGLAERLLGNRLKSYQLARYNNVGIPSSLAAGRVLKIPGEPPHVAAPPAPREEDAAPHASTPSAPRPKPVVPAHVPLKPATDPMLAVKMRAAGLTALNQGNVDRAVALLNRASTLDPANPLIARDRERAERISRTVKARH